MYSVTFWELLRFHLCGIPFCSLWLGFPLCGSKFIIGKKTFIFGLVISQSNENVLIRFFFKAFYGPDSGP